MPQCDVMDLSITFNYNQSALTMNCFNLLSSVIAVEVSNSNQFGRFLFVTVVILGSQLPH